MADLAKKNQQKIENLAHFFKKSDKNFILSQVLDYFYSSFEIDPPNFEEIEQPKQQETKKIRAITINSDEFIKKLKKENVKPANDPEYKEFDFSRIEAR